MKKVLIFSLILIAFVFSPLPVQAKKKLTRRFKSQTSSTSNTWTKLKLRVDKNALTVAFGNLNLADQVDYTLTYTSGDINQAVSSSLDLLKPSQQREFIFGTCSGTNCTYHQDITDMIFEVVFKLKSNQTLTRRYQINP